MSQTPLPELRGRRVALISSSYHPYPGGVEEHTRNVARELRATGHHVVVWTVDRGEHLGIQALESVEVHYLATPLPAGTPRGLLRFAFQLPHALWQWGQAFRRFRPEVLHVQCFGPNGIYALLLHHLTRAPLVVSAHGETFMDEHDVFNKSWLLRRGLERALRDASAVTGCSTLVLEDLRRRFALEAGIVVPNGVNLEEPANPDSTAPATVEMAKGGSSTTAGAQSGAVTIFALGRLVRVKGFDLLIRAFTRAALPPGSRLVIGGDGPELERLRSLARDCGMASRCDFLGRLDRTAVVRHMSEASIAVVPSRVEAFGIVILEVWRAAVPLVATTNGGPADIVTDGVDGLLVDPEDIEKFATVLERLAADPELQRRLGAAGRESVTAYTWRRTATDYERIYEEIAARPRDQRAHRWHLTRRPASE